MIEDLTATYTNSKIAERANLLDFTPETCFSSLVVRLEAISSDQLKTKGLGLKIRYGFHSTPFGDCLIATTARGICNLHFFDQMSQDCAEEAFQGEWANAEMKQDQQSTQKICDRVFNPRATNSNPLRAYVKGTNFQIQVWQTLLKIPFGGITTYQGLATAMGRPTATRAVANALARNPVAYLIPCHRVIRASGECGGFRWGVERKIMMLGWEASRYRFFSLRHIKRGQLQLY